MPVPTARAGPICPMRHEVLVILAGSHEPARQQDSIGWARRSPQSLVSEGGLEPPQSYLVRALKPDLAAKTHNCNSAKLHRYSRSLCPKRVHAAAASGSAATR